MNVSADSHGGGDLMYVTFLQQDIPYSTTKSLHLTFRQMLAL
jgi:hypothetical protein